MYPPTPESASTATPTPTKRPTLLLGGGEGAMRGRASVRSSASADGLAAEVFCPGDDWRIGVFGERVGRRVGGTDGIIFMGAGCAMSEASAAGSSLRMAAPFMKSRLESCISFIDW